jgi:tripartite-type tricarboxylate transporter receptor subunit TctC
VPKGTPDSVVDVLFRATNEVLADESVKRSLATSFEEVTPSKSVEEFVEFARKEGDQGLRLAKESRATAN